MRERSTSIVAAITAMVGVDELLLLVAMTLITVALWPAAGQLALLPAGVVLLWLGLPARSGFIVKPSDKTPTRREG